MAFDQTSNNIAFPTGKKQKTGGGHPTEQGEKSSREGCLKQDEGGGEGGHKNTKGSRRGGGAHVTKKGRVVKRCKNMGALVKSNVKDQTSATEKKTKKSGKNGRGGEDVDGRQKDKTATIVQLAKTTPCTCPGKGSRSKPNRSGDKGS